MVFAAGWAHSLMAAEIDPNQKTRDPQAVEEVLAGKRTLANAAWWGFDQTDSTEPLQAAIRSGARRLIVPYMGEPWIVRPIQLASDQEILLEPGVLILARQGEFQGPGDSLFSAVGQSNLVIRGYGACLRMRKRDYQNPPYKRGEWRMGLALRGCRHVLVEGLRVESSGGDGFYVDGGAGRDWSEDVTLRNCAAYDNHRQGVSVVSAVNLLIENCGFLNTWGTAPEAGIDFEPDTPQERLVHCLIRNSLFENNNGNEILVHLSQLTSNSEPVSIRFENCLARMTEARRAPAEPGPTNGLQGVAGITVGAVRDDGPRGLIEFLNCMTDNTGKEGARFYDKSAASVRVRLVNCSFRNPWNAAPFDDETVRVPILFQVRKPERSSQPGGVDFVDCSVYDASARPVLAFDPRKHDTFLRDVHGRIFAHVPEAPSMGLGPKAEDMDLTVTRAP